LIHSTTMTMGNLKRRTAFLLFLNAFLSISFTQSFVFPSVSARYGKELPHHSPVVLLRGGQAPPPLNSVAQAVAETARRTLSSFTAILLRELKELSHFQKGIVLGVFLLGLLMGRFRLPFRRFTSVMDIPNSYFGNGPLLRGKAISVSDGDTIRFYHVPTLFHSSEVDGKISEKALPIRVATIDTPETPKFGKPGQPFGKEAKQYLKNMVEDKIIKVRLLQKDQYGRAVAEVRRGRKHVDEEMLKQGLAEVYLGGGAVYGPLGKEKYLELEEEARSKKQGIWSQKKRESAADYKKRTK